MVALCRDIVTYWWVEAGNELNPGVQDTLCTLATASLSLTLGCYSSHLGSLQPVLRPLRTLLAHESETRAWGTSLDHTDHPWPQPLLLPGWELWDPREEWCWWLPPAPGCHGGAGLQQWGPRQHLPHPGLHPTPGECVFREVWGEEIPLPDTAPFLRLPYLSSRLHYAHICSATPWSCLSFSYWYVKALVFLRGVKSLFLTWI